MVALPEALLDEFKRGNALLFVGERIIEDATGQVFVDQLTRQLAQRAEMAPGENCTFSEAAQAYADKAGYHALVSFVRDRFDELGDAPQAIHCLIAGLQKCTVLVTTCLDCKLEKAFETAGRPLDVVSGNVDLAFEDTRKTQLYKLRGSLDRTDTLVLTEDQYENFFYDRENLAVVLQGYLARKTLLFIGYDLADSFFTDLYVKVSKPLDTYARQAYVFGESLSPKSEGWCSRHHITVLQASPKDSLLVLTRELAQKRVPRIASSQLAEKLPLPSLTRPYKFLDYYETNDASIFFGRDQVKTRLTSLIDAHRLVILYGASGTGKTSLLRAGVVPQLRNAEPPYVTVFVRMLEEPVPAIIGALQRQFSDLPDAVESETLRDFVAAACATLGRTLIIFLDQFEEFFLRFPKPSRERFIAELGALHDASDIPVKVVLSLREDWLAALSELEERIPDLFRIKLRLLPLTRDEAYQAITAPAELVGVRYETTLVDQLLGELMGSGGRSVSPPQLQLVCTALYDQLSPGEQEISLVMYNQLGGARGILQQYLANELDRFAPNERVLVDVLMGELITSQGTKKVKTATDLAFALDVDQATTVSLLERLTRARLLRMLKLESGETAYELSHEYLIRGIGLDTKAKARKAAKQLIEQEMENWKHFSTLMSEDKFKLIDPVRDELRLEAPVQGFLLRSAILADHSIGYWLTRVQDQQIRIGALADLARYGLPDVRRRVAGLLGEANRPEAIEPLLALVFDPDASVRTAARASLTRYPEQQPTIVGELKNRADAGNGMARRYVQEALAILPSRGLPTDLALWRVNTLIPFYGRWLATWIAANALFNAVAWSAGLTLIAGLGANDILDWVVGWAIGGIVGGIVGSIAQWLVLRSYATHATLWALTSGLMWAAAASASIVLAILLSLYPITNTTAIALLLITLAPLASLVIGWWVLKFYLNFRQAGRLLLINGIAWIVGVSVSMIMALSLVMNWMGSQTGFVLLQDTSRTALLGVICGAVGGCVYGAITGIPLYSLIQYLMLESEQETPA